MIGGASRGQQHAGEEDGVRPALAVDFEAGAGAKHDSDADDPDQQEAEVGCDIEEVGDSEQCPVVGEVVVRGWLRHGRH